jgi:hypothetical protein
MEKVKEETYSLPEELALKFILRGLDEELDPEELAEHYQALSRKYLTEAKEFLERGDAVQTSEKLWGASALAVKAVAAKRGLRLEKHGSLWDFISKLSKESGDRDIVRFFSAASGLHRNFYEDEMTLEAIEIVAEDIEQLIARLGRMP